MHVASLLPSATEIAAALGLQAQLVAISHECDYPAAVAGLPVLTRSAVATTDRTPAQIDADLSAHLRTGGSTYEIDAPFSGPSPRTSSSPKPFATSAPLAKAKSTASRTSKNWAPGIWAPTNSASRPLSESHS